VGLIGMSYVGQTLTKGIRAVGKFELIKCPNEIRAVSSNFHPLIELIYVLKQRFKMDN